MPIKNLVITADGREITLRGSVTDEQTKRDAAKTAERTYGVRTVTNLLDIRSGTTAPAKPVADTPSVRCQEELSEALKAEQIDFQPSWYGIQPESQPLLERLVEILNRCPNAKVEIGGHTDPNGILENNMALSRNRAQEVANYLIARGIPSARLTVVGHGPNKPIADNSTPEGMKKNRRIEFTITTP
jgi:OOP family OmpA-OmpF porin